MLRTVELSEPVTMPAAAICTSWSWWQEACSAAASRTLHTFKQEGKQARLRASPLQPLLWGLQLMVIPRLIPLANTFLNNTATKLLLPHVPSPRTTPSSLLQCSMIGWTCDTNHFAAVKIRSTIGQSVARHHSLPHILHSKFETQSEARARRCQGREGRRTRRWQVKEYHRDAKYTALFLLAPISFSCVYCIAVMKRRF